MRGGKILTRTPFVQLSEEAGERGDEGIKGSCEDATPRMTVNEQTGAAGL